MIISGGGNMAKVVLNEEEKKLFNNILGFTASLENAINTRKKSGEKITKDAIVNRPTYEFATLALQSNSPLQVIKVIEVLKKRYAIRLSFQKETLGFLDSIEGKAYGYMALRINNLVKQEQLVSMAKRCFLRAQSRGYLEACIDLADLENKLGNSSEAHEVLRYKTKKVNEANTKMGEIYCGISMLVPNAIRVLEGKRPFIEDISDYYFGEYGYRNGVNLSINCKMYHALLSIIIEEDKNDKIKALEIVKKNFKEFKEKNKDIDKFLFKTDADIIKENIDLIEQRILKMHIK